MTEDGIVSMPHLQTYGLGNKNDNFAKLCKCYDEIVNKESSINEKDFNKSSKSWNKYG